MLKTLVNALVIGFLALPMPELAWAQQQTQPVVITGSSSLGAPVTQPVGSGFSGATPMPVTGSFTPSGTQDVNVKQVGGTTVLTGAGATGAGSQRTTVALDSSTVAGSASLPAGTNVIGHVINDTGSTTVVTGNVTVVQPTGTNLHAVLDTTSTTAVTQATAANLNATVVGTGTFAVQATQSPSSASTAGNAPTSSSALAANTVIKGSAGNLYDFQVSADSTLSGAAWWVMVYNATSAPTDGAVTPVKCFALPSGATGISAAFPTPLYLGTGITIGVSTTGCFTKTASTHAFISGDAQ